MFGLDRTASRIVTGIIAVALILLAVTVLSFCQARKDAQRAKAEGRVAVGSQNAGKGAVEALEGQQEASSQSQELGRQNAQDIAGADNATDSAGDAGERAYRAWCRREQLRGRGLNDRCNRLLSVHP